MLLFLALLPPLCLAQQQILRPQTNTSSPLSETFAAIVKKTLEDFHIPGLSISVIDGQETYAEGYGVANLPDVPATPDSLYYGGSTTKAFTAAALSLLVDNGTITWTSKVSALLPGTFVLADEYATTHLTIEDILSHRSGLPRHDLTISRPNTSVADVVSNLRYLPLTAEPRTKFQYCNLMYATAGHVVERLTNTWLGTILHDHIWAPLGMTSTYFSLSDAIASNKPFANGYFWSNEKGTYIEVPRSPTDVDAGAGAVISTVRDYALWLRSLISLAPPLSRAAHEALLTPRTIVEAGTMGFHPRTVTGDVTYSLGWFRNVYAGQSIVSHGGKVPGFGAHALFIPALDWGVVIMANTQETSNWAAGSLAYHLMDEMLGVPESARYDWLEGYKNATKTTEKFLHNAKEILYPALPSPAISHSLPLEAYAGFYANEAFPPFEMKVHKRGLRSKIETEMFSAQIDLEHVSGEHWLATVQNLLTGEVLGKSRAEARVDVHGTVTEFGIEIDAELAGIGLKTWWARRA